MYRDKMEDGLPEAPEGSYLNQLGAATRENPPLQTGQLLSPVISMQSQVLVGPNQSVVSCPFCQTTVKTSTESTVTTRTHKLAFKCMFLCCCCLPYCMTSSKNIDHYCPSCKKYLGTYEK